MSKEITYRKLRKAGLTKKQAKEATDRQARTGLTLLSGDRVKVRTEDGAKINAVVTDVQVYGGLGLQSVTITLEVAP